MEWTDDGVILSRRRLGESDAVVALFTRDHGRHLGLVRGGAGRRHAAALQLGNVVAARWRARLEDQLGWFTCEPIETTAVAFLDDPGRLDAMAAALELLDATLPERQTHPELHAATRAFLAALTAPAPPAALLVRWEAGLLAALGFGLDLSRCAATGTTEDLAYVIPRSGRAVSRAGAGALAARLLVLPGFLRDPAIPAAAADIVAGLALTGHFLERHLLAPGRRDMPPARRRVVDRLARDARLRGP
jgi:DNA repair protein RecO (recombination protein O)